MGLPVDKLPVLEQFVSIQGEGKNVGVPYVFIRVGGCPLRCRFCDSEYTWTPPRDSICDTDEISKWAYKESYNRRIDWVSVTGGEPMIYPEQMKRMMRYWDKMSAGRIRVHIETSGRYYDESVHNMCDIWSMDIKTPCTEEVQEDDLEYLKYMRECDQVKCLIEDQEDLEYAYKVHNLLDGRCTLVLQPFNVSVDDNSPGKAISLLEKYSWLTRHVLFSQKPWTDTIITPQIHVLAFGNTPST